MKTQTKTKSIRTTTRSIETKLSTDNEESNAEKNSTDKTNGRFVERDWEKFDEPAYMRQPLRCRKKTATSDLEASRSLKNH